MPLDLSAPPPGRPSSGEPPDDPPEDPAPPPGGAARPLPPVLSEREVPWSRRRLKKLIPAAIFVLGLFAWQAWQGRQPTGPRLAVWQGPTMGTVYHLKVVGRGLDARREAALRAAVQAELAAVLGQMSTYDPQSALSRFNASPLTTPQPVPAELLAVVQTAQAVNAASAGAFDVTVGPLVNAWGFGPAAEGAPPDAATRDRLRAFVGADKLVADAAAGTLRKTHPEVYVDLSAIAKGYGVDRVADRLEAEGITDYLVEIGGEIRARGRNLEGKPWRIGVERPQELGAAVQQVVLPGDGAMATSGDYRNFRVVDGRRVSHTLDPRTGEPIAHSLASVTVFHARCAEADAWATALNVLGPEAGPALAEKLGLAALFLVRVAEDRFEARETTAFARHRPPAP